MERLAEVSGETVDLAVPVPGGVEHYLAQIDSRHLLGTTNWVGRRLPHHCTAVGKVLLAYGAAQLPPGGLEQLTPRTVTDRARLAVELEDGARRGATRTAVGELEPGLVAVAAPVLGGDGRAIAAISISGPEFRLRRIGWTSWASCWRRRPGRCRCGWGTSIGTKEQHDATTRSSRACSTTRWSATRRRSRS